MTWEEFGELSVLFEEAKAALIESEVNRVLLIRNFPGMFVPGASFSELFEGYSFNSAKCIKNLIKVIEPMVKDYVENQEEGDYE